VATNPAPKNIYDLCNEVYARHGQYGVFDYVGKFDNIEWTWCMPCESVTPFDPYTEAFVFNEDTERNDKEVLCLVCGSSNAYVNYKEVKAVVFYEDGTKAVQEVKAEDQLEFLQSTCKGYVECKPLPSQDITLWFNEEARFKNLGLVPNFTATKLWLNEFGKNDDTVLLGNVVITSAKTDSNGMITSLTAEQVERLVEL
jgi:hypothetical protein